MYVVLPTVVRVIRKGFRCSPDVFDPEERAALCSEPPDEDALILGHVTILVG